MANWKGLTLTANTASTVRLTAVGTVYDAYEYTVDDGATWNAFNIYGGGNVSLAAGASVGIRITANRRARSGTSDYVYFIIGGNVSLSGKINSMLTPSFETIEDINTYDFAFYYMFHDCTAITDASMLEMPTGKLSSGCCWQMFWHCTNLKYAPALPSTQLAVACYEQMFDTCTSLVECPDLPATTLTNQCYQNMFNICTSLVKPVALPATVLPLNCYYGMFNGCRNIKLATEWAEEYSMPYIIPSSGVGTTVESGALDYMFSGTGGTFVGTPSINTEYFFNDPSEPEYFRFSVIEGEATTISSTTYYKWSEDGVSWTESMSYVIPAGSGVYCKASNTTAPGARFSMSGSSKVEVSGDIKYLIFAEHMQDNHFAYLFSNCEQIVYAGDLVLSPNTLTPNCYAGMFANCINLVYVPTTLPATTLSVACYNGMFSGCTSIETTPTLPATTLAEACYTAMFQDCTSLTEAPVLPATELANLCYAYMFWGCDSIVEAHALPATELKMGCYQNMFYECSKLATVPEIFATTVADYSCSYMFYKCTSLNKPPKLYALNLSEYCYAGMFDGCKNMEISDVPTSEYIVPYKIPAEGTGTTTTGAMSGMFTDIAGPWKGDPEINRTYYLRGNSYKGLQLIANNNTNVRLNSVGAILDTYEYSLDNGETWINLPLNSTVELNTGDVMCVKIKNTQHIRTDGEGNHVYFSSSNSISATGNATSMITPNFEEQTNISAYPYALAYLFDSCAELLKAPELPARILSPHCYDSMFSNCTLLTEPPELKAIVLADECYMNMFDRCSSLTEAPVLSNETLSDGCYGGMFAHCTSLTKCPELPAMTMKVGCYEGMFLGCTGLTEVPNLPATGTAGECYASMFEYCTGITEPPILIAQSLAGGCYERMFHGCTSIEISDVETDEFSRPYRIPAEGTGIFSYTPTASMFDDTGGPWTGTPEVDRTYYLRNKSYKGLKIKAVGDYAIVSLMPNGEIKDMYEYSLDDGETWEWLRTTGGYTVTIPPGQEMCVRIQNEQLTRTSRDYVTFNINGTVSASGNVNSMIVPDFEDITDISKYDFALRKLFSGVQYLVDISELKLPADKLSQYCYAGMFENCHSTTVAPELPATELATSCYSFMFAYSELVTPPSILPATTLKSTCYANMFQDCPRLAEVPVIAATTPSTYSCMDMFKNCLSLTEPAQLPATELAPYCYQRMFDGCTGIKISDVMTDEYNVPYRIPTEGEGVYATGVTSDMFKGTTGPWSGTPDINTIYYLKGKPKEGVYHWTGTRWKLDGNLSPTTAAISDKGMYHWTGTRWKLDANVGGGE